MLSGRYRTQMLTRHWSSACSGACLAPGCSGCDETLEHILLHCPAYSQTRSMLHRMWTTATNYQAQNLASSALQNSSSYFLQFVLDASVIPEVIISVQEHGVELLSAIFHLTRSWCFAIHRERAKFQGRWKFC